MRVARRANPSPSPNPNPNRSPSAKPKPKPKPKPNLHEGLYARAALHTLTRHAALLPARNRGMPGEGVG